MAIPPHQDRDRGRVAVTLGDPRGIGPEVTFRAVERLRAEDPDAALLLLGPEALLTRPDAPRDLPTRFVCTR